MDLEALKDYSLEVIAPYGWGNDLCLSHERCRAWSVDLIQPITLAELVQRAGEHTEVCR